MPVTRSTSVIASVFGLLLAAGLSLSTVPVSVAARPAQGTASLPSQLSNAEFWTLHQEISEPGGYFRITDNYTSNEREVGMLFTMLRQQKVRGGVYMGVGPEQNFSYMAAIEPAMAFIVDIRRQAVMQHLMFKAMFELAANRAEFISLLFGKPMPKTLDVNAPIQAIWEAYFSVPSDPAYSEATYTRVLDRLLKQRGFTFTPDERIQFDNVFRAFYGYGPSITTRGSQSGRGGGLTFADLTGWAYDFDGRPQSFLSTEDHFRTIKRLHERNLIVPVSGDFGGTRAIRAIGAWLKARRATVSAFYVSNVEQYLFQDQKATAFYDNVATLPLAETSVFIRPYSLRSRMTTTGAARSLCPIPGFLSAVKANRIYSNTDALACAY